MLKDSDTTYSCRPNVIFTFKVSSFSFQLIAAQDIKVGEELYSTAHTRTSQEPKRIAKPTLRRTALLAIAWLASTPLLPLTN